MRKNKYFFMLPLAFILLFGFFSAANAKQNCETLYAASADNVIGDINSPLNPDTSAVKSGHVYNGAKTDSGFKYKLVKLENVREVHVYIVTLENDSFVQAQILVKKLINDSRNRKIVKASEKIKFMITGHGWRSVPEDHIQYAAFMSEASDSEICILMDFPEFRSNPISWHSSNVSASKKTVAITAAINTADNAEVWSMFGESGMAEAIIRMYDVTKGEIRNLLAVKSNIVIDSYPFSAWPFIPRKVNDKWLEQVGGSIYVNYTLFGNFSNKLRGGPKVVNICAALNGEGIPHGQYENIPEIVELERLEISGASIKQILGYVKSVCSCKKEKALKYQDINSPCFERLKTNPIAFD